MPTDWTYHADGVQTAVTTAHRLGGTLSRVTAELDTFRVREWREDEIENSGKNPDHLHYDEEKDVYVEHGNGAHATLRFNVDGGEARLSSIEPEDGDRVKPQHFTLLAAAERVVGQLDDVDAITPPEVPFIDAYESAEGVHIDALDA